MPRPVESPTSVSETRLLGLLKRGVDSDVARARLEWSDAESIARYVRPLVGESSIKPNVLPTAQVQGRWSTTDPPRITWPDHDAAKCGCDPQAWCPRAVREIVTPWPDTWWWKGDADAVEARIAAALTKDTDDLDAFAHGWDIHTATACGMFELPLPPVRSKKAIMSGPECEEWRQIVKWGGESDRRRHGCKSFRYAWQYAIDERGVLAVKSLHTLGLSTDEIVAYAKKYKQSKPGFFTARHAHMLRCVEHKEARTFLGRLRRLWGNPHRPADRKEMMKEGWSHMVSGSVSDITNIIVNDIYSHPDFGGQCEFISNGYDSLEMSFPCNLTPDFVIPRVKEIVNRTWDIMGTKMLLPWSWKVVTP